MSVNEAIELLLEHGYTVHKDGWRVQTDRSRAREANDRELMRILKDQLYRATGVRP